MTIKKGSSYNNDLMPLLQVIQVDVTQLILCTKALAYTPGLWLSDDMKSRSQEKKVLQ